MILDKEAKMSEGTHYSAVATSVQKTNEAIKDIQQIFGWESRPEQAYAAMRVVLQTLRDRLPVNEAVDFGAELPMLIRGIYYEGWRPSRVPIKMNPAEFRQEIARKFQFDIAPNDLVRGVMESFVAFVSPGEMDDLRDNLPSDIANMLPT